MHDTRPKTKPAAFFRPVLRHTGGNARPELLFLISARALEGNFPLQ
jgi:hypothetical protein